MDYTEDSKKHHPSTNSEKPVDGKAKPLGRRAALARLGLVAGVAYLVPTLALLQEARAGNGNGNGNGDDGYNPPWKHNSKPSKSKPGHGHGND